MKEKKTTPEQTIQARNRICLRVAFVAIVFYISGLLLFHAFAVFDTPGYDQLYYIWDKAKDCLFLFAVYRWHDSLGKIVSPIFYYSIIRLCFQISDGFIGTSPNAVLTVTVLFLIALAATIYLTITQIHRECSGRQK